MTGRTSEAIVDSFTQIALGAAIGDAGFTRKLGGKAALFGGVCGLLPDLDMFAAFFGDEWTTMVYHRGFSHSLVVLPLLAPLAALVAWRWDKKRSPYSAWLGLALLALLTHPLLDWFTSYGTMLFVPVSWHRYANDGIFIIDPVYSLPLFVALIWSWRLRRREAREGAGGGAGGPGAARTSGAPTAEGAKSKLAELRGFIARVRGPHITAAALAFTTAYLLFGLGVTGCAKSTARGELAASGFEPVRIRAMPMAFFPLIRRVAARDAGGDIMAGAVSLWAREPISFARFRLPDDPLVRKALESDKGKILSWFADGYVAAAVRQAQAAAVSLNGRTAAAVERERGSAGADVILIDQRYGFLTDPAASPFRARFEFDAEGRLERAVPSHGGFDVSLGEEMAAMWQLMWGTGGGPDFSPPRGGGRPSR